MRTMRIVLGVATIGVLFLGQLLSAQEPVVGPRGGALPPGVAPGGPEPPSGFPVGGPGFGRFGFEAKVVTGQPYSGVRTTTFVQTLADGSTITRTQTTKEARDSSGRLYRETQISEGPGAGRTLYSVFDPANRTITNWRSDTKQATVMHLGNRGGRGQWRREGGAPDAPDAQTGFRRGGPAPSVTQLGTKTISGVDATGSRTTMTIPAGKFGNSKALTVTHERWVASDLGITVMEVDNNPMRGVRTTTYTSLERNEPDAGLFQAPQGYTVVERGPGARD